MKLLLLAASFAFGSAALAQQMTNTQILDGSLPERDARGIPVISAPAEVPAGANQPVAAAPGAQVVPAPNQQAVFSTRQAEETYPPCTATVTDNCVQAYEGRRTSRRRR